MREFCRGPRLDVGGWCGPQRTGDMMTRCFRCFLSGPGEILSVKGILEVPRRMQDARHG